MDFYTGFKGTKWKETLDVSDFIHHNYTEYLGDERFLESATDNTIKLWKNLSDKFIEEKKKRYL